MKKFEFSMQRVLEYKAHIQKNEKQILSELRIRHEKLCAELEALISRQDAYKGDYLKKCRAGITVKDMIALRVYIGELQMQISGMEAKIRESYACVERQIGRVLYATQEKTSLQKLKEKHYGLYQAQVKKENEIFIDEFVANTSLSAYRQVS